MDLPLKLPHGMTEKQLQSLALSNRSPVTVGYIRISPSTPDSKVETTRFNRFSEDNQWHLYGIAKERVSIMTGWKSRKVLSRLSGSLTKGDRLLVDELSSLGRSVSDIVSFIARLHKKEVSVYDLKNNWRLDDQIPAQMIVMFYKMADQMDRSLISKRVKEGLAIRKAKGMPLGRKKGVGKSKLDIHKNDIIELLKTGSTKAYIMKKYGTSKTNLYNWLRRHKLDKITPVYNNNEKNGSTK